jgi:hypothetical protein
LIYSKVYLGVKKSHPEKKYAIKVMKKSDMVHKNMVAQGDLDNKYYVSILYVFCLFAIIKSIIIVKLNGAYSYS